MASFETINQTLNTALIALGIGIAPSLLWLYFWLKEDRYPEPHKTLFKTFVFGMLSVPFAIAFQYSVVYVLGYDPKSLNIGDFAGTNLFVVIFMWALIEEIVKFVASSEAALIRKEDDEPIDPVIYMITAALGFAAVENVLFILSPIFGGDTLQAISSINMRFIGATLLHILASGIIGYSIGATFYKKPGIQIPVTALGLCGAIALHTAFNLLIINNESKMFMAFTLVWIATIALIIAIEKLKLIQKP